MFGAGKSFHEVRKSDFTPHPPPVGGWVGWSVASFGDMCGVDPGYCALLGKIQKDTFCQRQSKTT